MIVTSIMPCIRVTKENNMSGVDMYIDFGDRIKITDIDGNVVIGKVLPMELGKDVEEDDMFCLLLDDEKQYSIGTSYIADLELL
ncbi:TPA: hypothetical protein PTV74_003116 [Clostridium botulinum]|nr:hypothetical protein [Clostridium botulinum]HDK7206271.1 hypothetical protein [Clostridium botulinum]HDK7210007.1 hypothetical protein [Clostridium botulinum]HDK7265456.1 hypothetical protein [Clostridium botulinum]HDK7269304.1 hypothetical protein [Clostridium botulinum]